MITASKRRASRSLASRISSAHPARSSRRPVSWSVKSQTISPAQLGGFRRAGLALGGKGERRVLLVLGREPSVPGELAHQALLSSVRSMNLRTRSDRDDAAVRRRRGVVRPRSRAW